MERDREDYILLTKDVSSLSSMGIVSHCLHLLDSHFKLFMSILLLVILPSMTPWKDIALFIKESHNPVSVDNATLNSTTLALRDANWNSTAVATLNETWDSTAIASSTQSSSTSGAAAVGQNHNRGSQAISWRHLDPTPGVVQSGLNWRSKLLVDPLAVVKALLISMGSRLLSIVLISIHRCFVAYSAGRIQVGKRATFMDAVHAFRVLWKPVLWTKICFETIDLAGTVFMYSPTLFFDKEKSGGSHLLYWFTFITVLFSYTFFFCSEFAFQLVTYVPILDQASGWEAFGRGWRLLKGRKRVAVGIAVCSLFAFGILFMGVSITIGLFVVVQGLLQGKLQEPIPGSKPSREFQFYTGVITQMGTSVHCLFSEMIYAVFCMSCMAFHQQSIVKSSFFQNLTRAGRDHDC